MYQADFAYPAFAINFNTLKFAHEELRRPRGEVEV